MTLYLLLHVKLKEIPERTSDYCETTSQFKVVGICIEFHTIFILGMLGTKRHRQF